MAHLASFWKENQDTELASWTPSVQKMHKRVQKVYSWRQNVVRFLYSRWKANRKGPLPLNVSIETKLMNHAMCRKCFWQLCPINWKDKNTHFRFQQLAPPAFHRNCHTFCRNWKRMNFSLIFPSVRCWIIWTDSLVLQHSFYKSLDNNVHPSFFTEICN